MCWRASTYLLVLAFFGLTPSYKKIVLDEIFLLCYHSQGGFTHDDVYNMPIRYRRYYLQKLSETIEKQQEDIDKKYGSLNSDKTTEMGKNPREKIPIPDFVTKVKAPKK